MNDDKTYLLYDADCGPCTRFMKIVRRFNGKLIAVSLQDPLSLDLVQDSMSREKMFGSFHIVYLDSGKKEIYSAGDGFVRLIESFPFGRWVAPIMERAKSLSNFTRWSYLQATRLRSSCANRKETATAFPESPEASFEAVSPA